MEIVLFIDENQSNTFFLVTDRKEMHKRKQTNHKQRITLKKNSVSLPPFLKEKIYNWRKNFLFEEQIQNQWKIFSSKVIFAREGRSNKNSRKSPTDQRKYLKYLAFRASLDKSFGQSLENQL